MAKIKTYISGKISGLPRDEYFKNFEKAYMYVFYRGEEAKAPIYFRPYKGINNWFCYMVICIRELLECDKILMLSNWKSSKGAIIEFIIAKLFKIEIEYYEKNS